jgi:hypothetical protein
MDVGGEIRLGSMLFTLVEPHPGHEVAYNRWYERDHFYAGCMVGPWLYAGRRWVATRELKDLRIGIDPPVFGDDRLGSYLALYFVIEGHHDEHFSWALRQVRWLHENGRMFEHRDHIHTLLYRYRFARPTSDPVPPELALDHPYHSLVVTMVERAPGVDETALTWPDAFDPPWLTLGFAPVPLPSDAPVSQPGLENLEHRTLLLSFGREDPRTVWDVHRGACAAVADQGFGRVVWSAPFIPTVPGTDTYTDQLW